MIKIVIVAACCLIGNVANAQQTKEQKVKELLSITGTTQMMESTFEQILSYYQSTYPDVPTEYWQKAMKLANFDQVIDQIIPVYLKHFSESEISDVIAFYKTTTGQKIIIKMPVIYQESMEIGREWGTELAKKIEKDILKEKNLTSPPSPKQRE
ncbi:hypothetical protein CO230_02955 [Chryseobacterium sp. 6424]|uniref:DUF2059 domain-containing protein n=1 Tax=Chryseobacterium sp. 6424 TaxID=2039166 RepID=UPI000EFB8605|nr:DUF2059 domain-containing protein [Chryseobacterium sp. 6424]AYO57174.1 hypothetical protein CO230_02955 [Chryseobacterium sp. 6424]